MIERAAAKCNMPPPDSSRQPNPRVDVPTLRTFSSDDTISNLTFLDLPSEAYFNIVHNLDAKGIAGLRGTSALLRDDPAISTAFLSLSLTHFRMKNDQAEIDPSAIESKILKSLAQCRKIPYGLRKLPILELIYISHLRQEKNHLFFHFSILNLMRHMDPQPQSEILQNLIETVHTHRIGNRYALHSHLRAHVRNSNLPHTPTLYMSLASQLLKLEPRSVEEGYCNTKKDVEGFTRADQTLPFSHLTRVLGRLDTEFADHEFQYYKTWLNKSSDPNTIIVLNGLLRGSGSLSIANQIHLLHMANNAEPQISSPKMFISHMCARAEFIKSMDPMQRCNAFKSSIDFWKTLAKEFHTKSEDSSSFDAQLALLPLAEAIPALKGGTDAYPCFKHIASILKYPHSPNGLDIRYFDRCEHASAAEVAHELIVDAREWREEAATLDLVGE